MNRVRRPLRLVVAGLVLIGVTAFLTPPNIPYVQGWLVSLRHPERLLPGQVTAFGGFGWRAAVNFGGQGNPRRANLYVRLDNMKPWPDATFRVESSEPWLPPFVVRFEGPTVNVATANLIVEAPHDIDEDAAMRIASGLRATTFVGGQAVYEVRFEDPKVTPPGRLTWYPDYVLEWWRYEIEALFPR